MREDLENRIKAVHSQGRLELPDESEFINGDYIDKIRAFIFECQTNLNVKFVERSLGAGIRTFHFCITLKGEPDINTWLDEFSSDAKFKWIQNNNSYYAVLHFDFSRVWPTYDFFYNIWIPNEEYWNSGKRKGPVWDLFLVDTIPNDKPFNDRWQPFFENSHSILEEHGILKLSEEELSEDVPFVLEADWFSGDDDDDDDDDCEYPDDYEPPLIATSVHRCLFSDEGD